MSTDGPILVFDGVCVLCSRAVNFVRKRDRKRVFRFAVMRSDTGSSLMVAHGLDHNAPTSVLLIDKGRRYVETAAIVRVFYRLGGAWRVAAVACWLVPRPLRDVLYRFVARHRYRWFGRLATCYVPSLAESDQFLP
jgi:predicted DCC family thiol-disulfide oxidoreductase YuxK